jgi:hypothetical protein
MSIEDVKRALSEGVEVITDLTEDELRRRWPAAFNDERLPLKVGIHRDMGIVGRCAALTAWVSHPSYLRNLARGERRINLHGAHAGAPVAIVSRYNNKAEIGVLDTAASIALTAEDCALITRVFCDSKAPWAIAIDLREHDDAAALRIGNAFASAMERVNGGHNGVWVNEAHVVEPYWVGDFDEKPATRHFLPAFGCSVSGLTYDFENRHGALIMPAHCCCDMMGCINVFRAIDPEVREIKTYSGDATDTRYERNDQGQWRAVSRDGKRFEWADIPQRGSDRENKAR